MRRGSLQLLLAVCALLVLALLLVARAEQPRDASQDLAFAASQKAPAYEQQQQQNDAARNQHSKGKKIQIVYIKVPLAKLKPSLGAGQPESSGNQQQQQQQLADNSTYDAGEFATPNEHLSPLPLQAFAFASNKTNLAN